MLVSLIIGSLISSCQKVEKPVSHPDDKEAQKWDVEILQTRADQHLDSSKWDSSLFRQDIETYEKYADVFLSYPLNKSPFPVAEYDYAVSSLPFTIKIDQSILKGVSIGEYENPESEKIIDRLTLMILTNDEDAEETTLVESRNYPYLTAQGIFKTADNEFDWVFAYSPDGYSTLLLNMKLFDLRFGETIIIYPQKDKSFLYDQINDSPNHYENFEDFRDSILKLPRVQNQLISAKNIN